MARNTICLRPYFLFLIFALALFVTACQNDKESSSQLSKGNDHPQNLKEILAKLDSAPTQPRANQKIPEQPKIAPRSSESGKKKIDVGVLTEFGAPTLDSKVPSAGTPIPIEQDSSLSVTASKPSLKVPQGRYWAHLLFLVDSDPAANMQFVKVMNSLVSRLREESGVIITAQSPQQFTAVELSQFGSLLGAHFPITYNAQVAEDFSRIATPALVVMDIYGNDQEVFDSAPTEEAIIRILVDYKKAYE